MTISKKATILIVLIAIFIILLFVSTGLLFHKIQRIRIDISIYQMLNNKIEKTNTIFWKLRTKVMESKECDPSLYNGIVNEIKDVKYFLLQMEHKIEKKRDIIADLDYMLIFLNQYKKRAEILRELEEKMEIVDKKLDSDYFSLLFYIISRENLKILNTLYTLNTSYIEYKGERASEAYFAIKDVLDVIGKNFKRYKNMYYLPRYVAVLKKTIDEDYTMFERLRAIKFQLNYITFRFEGLLDGINRGLDALISTKIQELSVSRKKLIIWYFVFVLIILIFFIAYVMWFLKSILIPIKKLEKMVEKVNNGNLKVRFVPHFKDEIAKFGLAFNDMLEKIHNATLRIKEEKEKVENANKLKSEFIKRISHELKTPLNGIMGFSQLLLESPLSNEQKTYLSTVIHQAERLKKILDEMLDFSSLDTHIEMEKEEFNLITTIKEAVERNRKKAEAKGLKLKFVQKVDVPERLWGNPFGVSKIFDALIDNAIKFTPKGEVEVGISEGKREKDEYVVSFYVRDTGIGIKKEEIPMLFDGFYQGDPVLNRRFEGIGIGLTIVKRLVESMGGNIWVESKPGEFTIFWFTLRFGISKASTHS